MIHTLRIYVSHTHIANPLGSQEKNSNKCFASKRFAFHTLLQTQPLTFSSRFLLLVLSPV